MARLACVKYRKIKDLRPYLNMDVNIADVMVVTRLIFDEINEMTSKGNFKKKERSNVNA